MTEFEVGQYVEADVSGTMPMLGQGSVTPGTIIELGDEPGIYVVQTDSEFSDGANRVNVFRLTTDRLRLRA